MGRTRTGMLLGALALVAGACGGGDAPKKAEAAPIPARSAGGPTGPQTDTVGVDGPSALGGENLVFGAYYPEVLSARPGDTIIFENRSSHDIHTVSFGIRADRSDAPSRQHPLSSPGPSSGRCPTVSCVLRITYCVGSVAPPR